MNDHNHLIISSRHELCFRPHFGSQVSGVGVPTSQPHASAARRVHKKPIGPARLTCMHRDSLFLKKPMYDDDNRQDNQSCYPAVLILYTSAYASTSGAEKFESPLKGTAQLGSACRLVLHDRSLLPNGYTCEETPAISRGSMIRYAPI